MREQQRIAIQHPAKIHPLVDLRGQTEDFRVRPIVLASRKNSRQQQRGVNRRNFTLPSALACLCVQPVIEPPVKLLGAISKETQGGPHALLCLAFSNPFSFSRDAKGGQAKACRRNARHAAMVFVQRRVVGARAVRNQAGPGISLLPKILELAAFHVFEKYFVRGGMGRLRAGLWLNCAGRKR